MTTNKILPSVLDNNVMFVDYHVFPETCITVCCITMKNGYNTVGHSGCVDPENFNEELGKEIAKNNAWNAMYHLLSYELKQKMYDDALAKVS